MFIIKEKYIGKKYLVQKLELEILILSLFRNSWIENGIFYMRNKSWTLHWILPIQYAEALAC